MSAASASTAIGTIATVDPVGPGFYRGRFAPSPTGDLHLGSLLAAVASYLEARRHGGAWLLRMEDLDTARNRVGAADRILRTLEAFGFEWEGPVVWQSERRELYDSALARLQASGVLYRCGCSRRERGEDGACVGGCREQPPSVHAQTALRLHIEPGAAQRGFADAFQGSCLPAPADLADPIVQRRDGIHAYLLAVVVDDAAQGVTDVVRGADLLGQTHAQIALLRGLGLAQPRYGHVPLITEPDGTKLAKSRRSVPLDPQRAGEQLWLTLALLRQQPPTALRPAPVAQLLAWALAHWNPLVFSGIREVRGE